MSDITIVVDGDTEPIVAESFLSAVSNSLEVLKDLETAISMRRRTALKWVIGALHFGSPAMMTLRPIAPPEFRDISAQVVEAYLDGLELLLRDGHIPEYFSDDALEAVKRLARIPTNGVRRLTLSHNGRTVRVTERIAVRIDELIGQSYLSEGTIEGRLEMVTVHQTPYFRIYDAIHGLGIPCYFDQEILEQVRSGLNKRVIVSGRIRSDRIGKPESMRVSNIEVLEPRPERVTPSKLRGLGRGMTEGKLAEDYLRELRDDNEQPRRDT